MGRPGDQHRENGASANPFAPAIPKVSGWTAREIATLQSRLDKQLGPEFISTRPGPSGGKVHYLAAEKVINLANEVFGFNGWSSSIQNVQVDFVDEQAQTGKITLGLSTIVRVTLRDGSYHEDIGYGHIENCKGKAAAFEKAKKESVTDGLKRALRNFGNMLGNCLYDKDYLQKVTKIKAVPTRWDEENLHRHTDFEPRREVSDLEVQQAPLKGLRAATCEDDFETNMFDDLDFSHTDSNRTLDNSFESPAQRAVNHQAGMARTRSMPSVSATKSPETMAGAVHDASKQDTLATKQSAEQWQMPVPQEPPADLPSGFITGKAVELLSKPPEARPPAAQMAFDPHHESPGLRRTQGVNPGKSAPVKLSTIGRPVPDTTAVLPNGMNGPAVGVKTNFVNPSLDPNRRIGMPQTPLSNRGAYKPPSALKRPALADLSNVQQAEGNEAKKCKIDTPVDGPAVDSTTLL